MKIPIILLTAALLSACGKRVETCNDGGPHDWELWRSKLSGDSNIGYETQIRECSKCGVAQVEDHK